MAYAFFSSTSSETALVSQGARHSVDHGVRRQRRRLPAGLSRISHYHDTQDELYFVHSGTAKVEVDGEERILGPGGLFHVESTTPRRIANVGDEEPRAAGDRRQGRLRRARRPRHE